MATHTLQINGTRGELTPLMHARVDTDFYQAGWHTAHNMVISRYGSMIRAPGSLHRGTTKLQNRKSRLIAFEFNEEQVYALEFGHLYMRVWTRSGYISATPPTPYEIVTPFAEADLPFLHGAQSGDAVYLWCDGKRPQVLKRLGETNWTIEPYAPKDGPYLPVNATDVFMTLSDTGHISPAMTSNTVPADYVVSSVNSSASAYLLFSRDKNQSVSVGPAVGWVQIDLGAANARVVDAYWMTAGTKNHETDSMPTQWDLQGSDDGSTWFAIDSRDGETGWSGSETRYFEFTNRRAFRYYRISYSGGSGNDPAHTTTEMGQIALKQAAFDMTPKTLTLSNVSAVNSGGGFLASDIGRSVRLLGADGRWRWAEITARASTTVVSVRLHGQAFPDTSPMVSWRMGAWSDASGWPVTGRFFEDRLTMASTDTDPLGVWMSVNGGYDQFRVSQPVVDDDALTLRLSGGVFSRVNWLAEVGTLLVGTGAVLRSIGGRDTGSVLSPTNVRQRAETTTTSSKAQPVEVETVVLFIDRYRQRLFEAAYSYEADGYLTRELSILNEHLFGMKVDQIEWLDTPHKIAVCRREDGKLVFFSYDREQKVAGATLIDYGGIVEDVMTLPGPDGTDLFLTVNRGDGSGDRRYIELMAPFWRGGVTAGPPVYGSSSFVYTGVATSTVSGLTWLALETVGVWADGRDIGDVVVSAGGVATLPHNVTATTIVIGRRMPWKLRTLRLSNYGQRDGIGIGRNIRIASAVLDTFEAAGIRAGTLAAVYDVRYEDEAEENPDEPVPLRTEAHTLPVDDSWQNRGIFVIEGDKLYPVTVRGVSLIVEGE